MNSNKLAFIGGSGIYKLDILNEVIEHGNLGVYITYKDNCLPNRTSLILPRVV